MALTKVIGSGVQGIANASNATFLTATSAEGVTLAGTLAVTGVHTIGNNAVATSEGGAVTMSAIQGLAKHFTVFKGTDTFAGIDSFNQSSIADVSTGLHRTSFTSNFGSINYAVTGSIVGSVTGGYHAFIASDGGVKVTSSVDTLTINAPDSTAAIDMDVVQLVSHGDLA